MAREYIPMEGPLPGTRYMPSNGEPRGRMGWSKVLERLRLAVPRKCSLRWLEND